MKLKIRKIKKEENETLNKKPFHLVDLKISKNKIETKKEKIIFSFLEYLTRSQKIINETKSFLQKLTPLKKINDEFSESKKALVFYSKKFFILFKKNNHNLKSLSSKLSNFYPTKITSYLIELKNQYLVFLIPNKKIKNKKHQNIPLKKIEQPDLSIPININKQKQVEVNHSLDKKQETINPLSSKILPSKKRIKRRTFLQNLIFHRKDYFNIALFLQQISRLPFKKQNFIKIKDNVLFFLKEILKQTTKYFEKIKNRKKPLSFSSTKKEKINSMPFSEILNPVKKITSTIYLHGKTTEYFEKYRIKSVLVFILIAFAFVLSLHFLFLTQKFQNPTKETNKNILEITNEINLSDFISNQQQLSQIIKLLPANSKNNSLFKAENYLSSAENFLTIALNKEKIKRGTPTEQIADFQNNLLTALPKIQITNYYLSQVKLEIIPKQNRNEFNQIKIYLSKLENNIQEFLDYSKILLKILGHEKKQRYLIVLQNNDKIRPTGGSIEASILVDVNQGIIKKVETQDTVFLQKDFKSLIQPPYPLRLVNSFWQAQDANWFFDFPTSAQKIIWFYQKSVHQLTDNKKINGVISLNANLIPKILEITGPTKIPMDSISDFIPELLNKILSTQNNSEQFLKTLEILNESLSKKDIMFYSNNSDLQKDILKNNWAGEIKSINNGDYLAVVNANINGGSDKNIEQSINLQTQILDDDSIINTVKITRTYLENDGFAKNLNYIKIYVPKGSAFLEIKGFKKLPVSMFKVSPEEALIDEDLLKTQKQILIDEATETRIGQEFDKTVFGNWIEVKSGESATIMFKYKLPFKFEDFKTDTNSSKFFQRFYNKIAKKINLVDETLPYQLLIQKQSGSKDDVWKYSIALPISWQLVWQNFPVDFIENDNQIEFNSFLNQDQLWTMLLKKL